ncbi:MAG TPA: hypothetical protein EYG40_02665 [Verrucomicrobia bacterium]|nr:hypothetical protein [Verrucomicrobiales bacterium]HIL53922.1 hypothetical protein [Verrucomicrobiota bacterium]
MSENTDFPKIPRREVLVQYLGKMLLARGIGLPKHGEPWQLVQLTEPTETGTINEVSIMAFEVLFLTPKTRESGTYVFTNESNELIGAMYCTTFISSTKATCMQSLFSSTLEDSESIEIDPNKEEL